MELAVATFLRALVTEHWPDVPLKQVLGSYGYSEIRLPIVEQTPLFKRAIGEVTDVVEKEMYTLSLIHI